MVEDFTNFENFIKIKFKTDLGLLFALSIDQEAFVNEFSFFTLKNDQSGFFPLLKIDQRAFPQFLS